MVYCFIKSYYIGVIGPLFWICVLANFNLSAIKDLLNKE